MKNHTIDAQNKKIGRIASEAAFILMGKDMIDFSKNTYSGVKVTITNASKADISITKMKTTIYKEYSGYPGGQKEIKMSELVQRRGYKAIFQKAVRGMLPPNKLRAKMLANLSITE